MYLHLNQHDSRLNLILFSYHPLYLIKEEGSIAAVKEEEKRHCCMCDRLSPVRQFFYNFFFCPLLCQLCLSLSLFFCYNNNKITMAAVANVDVTKLTPLSPEVISKQATINIGKIKKQY